MGEERGFAGGTGQGAPGEEQEVGCEQDYNQARAAADRHEQRLMPDVQRMRGTRWLPTSDQEIAIIR